MINIICLVHKTKNKRNNNLNFIININNIIKLNFIYHIFINLLFLFSIFIIKF